MRLRALPLLTLAVFALPVTHDSVAAPGAPAGHSRHPSRPCRLLPESQQPKAAPRSGGAGNLVAMVPATTCNTPR